MVLVWYVNLNKNSRLDLFLDCLRIKVLRKRQAIQELLLAIYAGVKDAKVEEPIARDVSGKTAS